KTEGESKNYILITDDKFYDAAKNLATWKRQLGYSVELISSDSWTAAKVKDTIHTLYQQWTPRPDYFVILGDHDFVPGEIHYSPDDKAFSSDLYFACMNGGSDYFPDMAHGRISVSSPEEAISVVNKIIKYEALPVDDEAFYKNGVNCAQFQDDELDGYATRRFAHTSEDIRDYVLLQEQEYDIQRIYYTNNNITPTNFNNGWYSSGEPIKDELLKSNGFQWNGGQWDIASAINQGKFYVFHRDHGYAGGSGWAHPYFVNSSIDNLSNGNKTPVVFSINCHTGEFKLNECFSEKLLRYENGGAVGVFAASYYSYSGFNDGLSCGFIDAIYPNPGLIPSFGEGGISYPNITPHEQILTMGNVLNQGLIRMGETWGLSRYTNELFHYFGDPAMKLWIQKPEEIFANNQDTVFYETQSSIEISDATCVDAIATLVNNNKILDIINLENGAGTLNSSSIIGDKLIITISKEGYKPYIDTIFVAGKPMAQFSVSDTVSCDGEINFTNSSIYHPNSYTWHFGDDEISNEINPTHFYQQNGTFQVSLITKNDFGADTAVFSSLININRPIQPIVFSDTVCVQGEVRLYNTDGFMCKWYDKESGELLSFGNEFTTPVLTNSKEYQVESVMKKVSNTGKIEADGEHEFSNQFGGLLFDVYQNFTLKSVKVFTKDSAIRVIQLRDADYNVIISDTITVDKGEQRIELNWQIEPYNGYKLIATDVTNMTVHSTGINYPYNVDDVLSIFGSTFVPNPTSKYYFFYDWEVESFSCFSTRVDVLAKVENSPTADFDVTVLDPNITVQNNSANGANYYWDFGDENYSSQENPEHVYNEDGEYTIQLIVKNACASDTTTKQIEIKTSGFSSLKNSLKIYPNPAKTNLFVVVPTNIVNGTIEIKDITGRTVLKTGIKNKKTEINIRNLVAGNYFITLVTEKYKITRKLVVIV
ncbi:MAG: C25 family cysteine peptidase, partial [Bacteroidota bacterium]|nr:C25 family cysteine peptidase [Bacteroidota bacterium]